MNRSSRFWIAIWTPVVAILFAWLLIKRLPRQSDFVTAAPSEAQHEKNLETTPGLEPVHPRHTPSDERKSKGPVEAEPLLTIRRLEQPPLNQRAPSQVKIQGFGGNAVLTDKDGTTLLKATPMNPIVSLKSSPSGRQVIISRGNGIHQIYLLNPFSIVRELPLVPKDIPRASSFSPWDWIDESTLITSVDIERPAAELEGRTGVEIESDNSREQTLLYSLNLVTGTISKIEMAKAGLPPSFTVVEMRSGGQVKVEWEENGSARTAWLLAGGK